MKHETIKSHTDAMSPKQRLLFSLNTIKKVRPNQEVHLTDQETDAFLYQIATFDIAPIDGDVFHSGRGSGAGAYETYLIDGVRYDIVTPDLSNQDQFSVVRFEPIDWESKIRTVELMDEDIYTDHVNKWKSLLSTKQGN